MVIWCETIIATQYIEMLSIKFLLHILYSENKCQNFLKVELLHNFTKVVITNSPNSFGISFGDSLLFYPPASFIFFGYVM